MSSVKYPDVVSFFFQNNTVININDGVTITIKNAFVSVVTTVQAPVTELIISIMLSFSLHIAVGEINISLHRTCKITTTITTASETTAIPTSIFLVQATNNLRNKRRASKSPTGQSLGYLLSKPQNNEGLYRSLSRF